MYRNYKLASFLMETRKSGHVAVEKIHIEREFPIDTASFSPFACRMRQGLRRFSAVFEMA